MPNGQGVSPVSHDDGDRSYIARTVSKGGLVGDAMFTAEYSVRRT